MPTTPPPRRRLFHFGLGTLFLLMTSFAVWLGWELKFVRERKEFLSSVREAGGMYATVPPLEEFDWHPKTPYPTIPFWRQWLGDEAVAAIILGRDSTQNDKQSMWRLFPEADVLPKRD